MAELLDEIARWYVRFADTEAHGSSETYDRLARATALDVPALEFLATLPEPKRQPNLLFGALRWYDVPVGDPHAALVWLSANQPAARQVIETRRTQTNEVARCATLLPALAMISGPLALIEVGCSAGLCLLYDRWRYHYVGDGVGHWVGDTTSPVTLTCPVTGAVPLPDAVPEIVWRAGLDLNPLDAADPDTRRWLECLVWPEHIDRAERLAAALDVAATAGLSLHQGDLAETLPDLLAQAPSDATLVVTHSATLAYLDKPGRQRFLASLGRAHRLGAEGPRVLPELLPGGLDVGSRVVVSLDDRALALAHPHGRSLDWL